jgi:hypothetical protein
LTEIISILKEKQKYHSAMSQEQKTINSCTSKPSTNSLLYTADDWGIKSTKGKKGSSEGNMEIRNNEVIRSKNETVEMRNRFSALATDDGMQISEN